MARDRLYAYSLISPALLAVLAIVVYPVFFLLQLSLSEVSFVQGRMATTLSGFGHYSDLTSDGAFLNSAYRTGIFTVSSVFLSLIAGLSVALAVNEVRKGVTLVRLAVLLPWLLPPVVSGLIWRWMFHDQFGLVNWILMNVGLLQNRQPWLADVATAMPSVIWVDVWIHIPFVAIILLAGLQTIPNELYEAVRVDGGSSLRSFWHVTLPLLRPYLLLVLLIRAIFALRVFDIVVMLAGSKFGSVAGAPAGTTQVFGLLIWQRAIEHLQFAESAAIAVIVLVLTFIVSFFSIKMLPSKT